jgi:hypothetical protein
MRGVCQLNLETANILGEPSSVTSTVPNYVDSPSDPAPHAPPPLPIRPEDLLEQARRGLQVAARRAAAS